jgi:hypothetical protein
VPGLSGVKMTPGTRISTGFSLYEQNQFQKDRKIIKNGQKLLSTKLTLFGAPCKQSYAVLV